MIHSKWLITTTTFVCIQFKISGCEKIRDRNYETELNETPELCEEEKDKEFARMV